MTKKRQTNYRFRHKGDGKEEWLTDEQLKIATIVGVKWYPTVHASQGDDPFSVTCPTPHICGWYCSDEDEQRIKRVMQSMEIKNEAIR